MNINGYQFVIISKDDNSMYCKFKAPMAVAREKQMMVGTVFGNRFVVVSCIITTTTNKYITGECVMNL